MNLEEMYDRVDTLQAQSGKIRRGEDDAERYGSQFLIVYARDLIASMSYNQIVAMLGGNMIASATAMDYPVRPLSVRANF
jgi:hypothetical protein